jgi:hypothetical protein
MAAAKSARSKKDAKPAKIAKPAKSAKSARAVSLDEFVTLNIETRAILDAVTQALRRLERAIDRAQQVGIATPNASLQEPTPHGALQDAEHEHDGTHTDS